MSEKSSCLIIAGEKSGEDHAMTFFPELKRLTPDCEYYGVGGSRLQELGVDLRYHLKDFSGIGISEVLSKIPFYYKALDEIVTEVKKRKTKTAILIDFQGFNLKLSKKLKKLGVNVLYYVAPQAWVWKPWRAKVLQKNVHTLFTILPFEKKWFLDRGVSKVKAVIHPLILEHADNLNNIPERSSQQIGKRKLKLLILPGSRNVEVENLLPIFEKAMSLLEEDTEVEFGLVKTESVRPKHYANLMRYSKVWSSAQLADAMYWADLCVAASGTVTLATGLFQVPTVVCYKVSFFTEAVLSLLLPYDGPISLTNIIHDKMLFPELVQYKVDRYNIVKHLKEWINNPQSYDTIVSGLKTTKTKLTGDNFSVPEYMANVINAKS
ncbi:MAG: lipid-A-disaccharide synthase [Halobacteriovoraceae bacterium]|jgi:lipid-A-disaccharide synthase|nr:lipid-A-disaccharide synthase [Halobacteriovoraceae bacterium]